MYTHVYIHHPLIHTYTPVQASANTHTYIFIYAYIQWEGTLYCTISRSSGECGITVVKWDTWGISNERQRAGLSQPRRLVSTVIADVLKFQYNILYMSLNGYIWYVITIVRKILICCAILDVLKFDASITSKIIFIQKLWLIFNRWIRH